MPASRRHLVAHTHGQISTACLFPPITYSLQTMPTQYINSQTRQLKMLFYLFLFQCHYNNVCQFQKRQKKIYCLLPLYSNSHKCAFNATLNLLHDAAYVLPLTNSVTPLASHITCKQHHALFFLPYLINSRHQNLPSLLSTPAVSFKRQEDPVE